MVLYLNNFRMLKKAVQQGRSEVRDAKNMSVMFADGRESVSTECLGRGVTFPARPKLLWQLWPGGTLKL